MPKDPKIKIEDLPKEEAELADEELESVAGGVKKHIGNVKYGDLKLTVASDPDSGDE